MHFNFDNTYARELEGFYIPWQGAEVPAPAIVKVNEALAHELHLDPCALQTDEGAAILAGARSPADATPLAQVYAGHQFGGFSPRLGDGRALLVGELIDRHGQRRDLHLKGSGRTPFSRGGDGKAVLGPVLREYLMGEAMYALGIPTTRALAAVTTGESIRREGLLPGAVLARVAASHIRVGTFQFFAAQGETEKVRQLADYAITRHYPELAQAENPYLAFLSAVCQRQAALIAQWMTVGFVHGVMNTDNMSILGLTLDYGPYGFLDAYDPDFICNHTDEGGRYSFSNQPGIGHWNLRALAVALSSLIGSDMLVEKLNGYEAIFIARFRALMRAKLGLVREEEGDDELIRALLRLMAKTRADYSQTFRGLTRTDEDWLFLFGLGREEALAWREKYRARMDGEGDRRAAMDAVNPKFVLRNWVAETAIRAVEDRGDVEPLDRILKLVQSPYAEHAGEDALAEAPSPEFLGLSVSCSS